jgi:hypothetical protein
MSSDTAWKVTVTDVDEQGDECYVEISLDDDFMEKFKESKGLRRWSDKRFSEWFVDILKKTVETLDRKDKFETVYDLKEGIGCIDDVSPGDMIEYHNKNGATHFREVGEIVEDRRCKAGRKIRTAPMMEGEHVLSKAESVQLEQVGKAVRKKS